MEEEGKRAPEPKPETNIDYYKRYLRRLAQEYEMTDNYKLLGEIGEARVWLLENTKKLTRRGGKYRELIKFYVDEFIATNNYLYLSKLRKTIPLILKDE